MLAREVCLKEAGNQESALFVRPSSFEAKVTPDGLCQLHAGKTNKFIREAFLFRGQGYSRQQTTFENRMHQSKQFGELLATANGFTLMKTKYRDAMDGYCFGSTETEKEWGGKIEFRRRSNLKALSVGRRKHESAVLWARTDRTRNFWPRQKSHRLFLPGEVILCVLVTN